MDLNLALLEQLLRIVVGVSVFGLACVGLVSLVTLWVDRQDRAARANRPWWLALAAVTASVALYGRWIGAS